MKRYFASIAACTLMLGFFSISPAKAGEVVWPTFMWAEANNAPFLNELKRTFEKDNPGDVIKNITIPIATFWDKQFVDVASGNSPDIATMYDPEMRTYLEADLLEPLDKYLEAANIEVGEFVPTSKLAQKDGKIYAIPYQNNPRALFYNERLLKAAGIQPPQNAEDFLKAIRALRNPGAQQFGFMNIAKPGAAALTYIEIMPIVAGFGGGFFKGGKPSANAPETVSALRFLKTLYDEQLTPRVDNPTYKQMFAEGKVATYVAGAFMASVVEGINKNTYSDLKSEALPLPSGKTISVTVFLGIPKSAKNKDLAAKVLIRMLRDDMQSQLAVLGKTIPGRLGTIPIGFARENPWFETFEQAAKTAVSYAPDGAEKYGAEIMKVVADHYEQMLFRGLSAEETANNLQKALTDFIEEKAKK
jgi:multiple sugar transport system substrate-binding protein